MYLLFAAGGMIGIDDVSILGNGGRQDGTIVVAIRSVGDNDQQSRGTKQEQVTNGKSCADRTELADQLHHLANGYAANHTKYFGQRFYKNRTRTKQKYTVEDVGTKLMLLVMFHWMNQ
ncbi:hypothetical protein DAPPUDRAFT_110829 [Daphnia pulex]|uniref:Uncharacterized protein n=1 Tax=Daphnia pulex TaxID=6669 RepID=E9H796_DAPPU|nr:hypothetical protein DAPPUDRAFT_110829 [Daphnia pulex]|eukprot:EFX72340.1 hypothetical protein DAPPUDRAFT_110829 [Daphnia pulex]